MPKKGDCVKPLRTLKSKGSVWPKKFGKGKTYKVRAIDKLGGKRVLVLKTGLAADNYEIVYPSEVKKVKCGGK